MQTMVLQSMAVGTLDVHSNSGSMMATSADTPSAHEEQIEPPLYPLEPVVAVHEPELLAVTATSASFSWAPATWHLPEHDDRQAEFQQRVIYSLEYELQVQQVDVGPPTDSTPVDQLLQQVYAALQPSSWKSVAHITGAAMPELQQVNGLRSGRFYAARIVATARAVVADQEHVAFPAAGSQVVPFRTLPTPPGQMQAPALAQRARNALKLKWNVPDETGGEAIGQYELLVTPQPAGWEVGQPDEQGFIQVYVGNERNFMLRKLGPGQRFSFKIRAFNILGSGPWSLPSTFTTQPSVPAQPDPPVQLASSKDTATLQWSPPADNGAAISCYQLEVDDGRQGEFRLAYTGQDTHCIVQQLQSGLNYRFRLRAENAEGYSMWSSIAAAATAATVPGCPTGLSFMGINRTSVTLTWRPPLSDGGSAVLGYQVQLMAKTKVASAALGTDWIIIFDGPAVATTFSALQPGCEYMMRVAARNAAGQGAFCIPVRLTTASDIPMAPPAPEAEAAATSLLLRWSAPSHDGGSAVTGYKVEMRCSPHTDSSSAAISPQHSLAIPEHFLGIYSGQDTCVQVTDLLPGTTYEYRAAALNSHGAGPWSAIGTATTLPAAPLPPPLPALVAATNSSLSVTWEVPYGQGSPVTSYTLNMARLGPVHATSSSSSTAASVCSSSSVANGTADGAQHADIHDDAASSCSSSHNTDKVRWETVYTGPLLTAEIRNLKPASRYALRVRAHNSIGGSNWGEALTVSTAPAAPCQPCSVTATALSSSRTQLRWAPPHEDNGAAVGLYQVELAEGKASSSSGWSKVWQGSGLEYEHDGLLPGRVYSWRVRAINCCGAGAWSDPVKGVTLPAEPGAPGKPGFGQRTATSVRVKWSIPLEENGSAVIEYMLQVRQQPKQQQRINRTPEQQQDQYKWREVYKGAEPTYKVTGLQPGCSYEARVTAVNAVGAGAWSESSCVDLPLRPPPPPASLTAELDCGAEAVAAGASAPRLLASWPAAEAGADSADAVSYEVEATPSAGSSSAAVKATVAKQTSASIAGLQLGITYNVRVRSVGKDGAGHSNWSTPVQLVVPAPSAPASEADTCDSPGALLVASNAGDVASAKRTKNKSRAKTAAAAKDAPVADKRRLPVQASAARAKPKASTFWSRVADVLPKDARIWLRKHWRAYKGRIPMIFMLLIMGILLLVVYSLARNPAPAQL